MTREELLHLARVAPHLTVREVEAAREEGIAAADRWLLVERNLDRIEAFLAGELPEDDEQPPDSGTWFVLLASDE